jgi:hypothetical protein
MWCRRFVLACAAVPLLALGSGCRAAGPEVLTPEAARAKGDAMLKSMSDKLAQTTSFSYTADQEVERVRSGGEKVTERFSRRTIVQRPNRLAFSDTGQDHEAAAWYDGNHVTLVSHRDKVWARGPMPDTLDAAMDYVSAEYAIQIPTADLLYSNPYQALITPDTTGGWVGVDQVGGSPCEHLSYQQSVVDWELWLTQDDRRLPRKLQITYKTAPGQPVARIAFSDWNEAPTVTDATFSPTVPDGYTRIKIMRHATLADETTATAEGETK